MHALYRLAEGPAVGKIIDMIEIAAPEGGTVRLLQGDDIRTAAPEQGGDAVEVGQRCFGSLQKLVEALATPVRDVDRHDPQAGFVHSAGHADGRQVGLNRGRGIPVDGCAARDQQG